MDKTTIGKGKIRCGICDKIFPVKSLEAKRHFDSKEHLKKAYEHSLDQLVNLGGFLK